MSSSNIKRKKTNNHSHEDINNVVLTAPNDDMMKNKLTNNNELVNRSVIEDKCFSVDNIGNKPETANMKRQPSRQIYKKKLQLSFANEKTKSSRKIFTKMLQSGFGHTTGEYVQTNSEDDEFIIVTDPFIRQQNNEYQITKTESQDLFSRCSCQHFFSLKNVGNKLFNTKIKHFAFNNDAKKVRQSILHQKYLEANILEMLITKEHKKIIQSIDHIPIFNSISIHNKFEEYINLKENDHIEPNTLSILKDVYEDVEYVTDYCNYNTSENQFSEQQTNNKDIKFNNQAFKVKPIEKQHVLKSPKKIDYVLTLTEDDKIIIDTKTSTRQLDIEFQIRKTESQGHTTGEYVQTNSEDDEFIIVTDPFIRQQNNEF